jgi:hypothetical protein
LFLRSFFSSLSSTSNASFFFSLPLSLSLIRHICCRRRINIIINSA